MSIIDNVLSKVVGSRHDRVIKKFTRLVAQVNSFEKGVQALSDDELKAKTQQFRERLNKEGSVEDILPEALQLLERQAKGLLGRGTTMFSSLAAWFSTRAAFLKWEQEKEKP